MSRNAYSVAAVLPFWRYAVAIEERPDLPAVPFWRHGDAWAFYDESSHRFPDRTTVLLRRRWSRRTVEMIAYAGAGWLGTPATTDHESRNEEQG